MRNSERSPAEAVCRAGAATPIEVLAPRSVVLGEPGTLSVRGVLP